MERAILPASEVLRGYDSVFQLYPHVPSLSHWRAWECAAYRHFRVDGRILDLGCGDGRYFHLIWPHAAEVIGVDIDPEVAELGRQSGVYVRTHVAVANAVPEPKPAESFDHVFVNCSIEHVDHLDAGLAEIARYLSPGGMLLCSVVTERFVEWSVLPELVRLAGFDRSADTLRNQFLDYHYLVNPLTVDGWTTNFQRAGLVAEAHISLLPKHNAGAFLLMDNLWHVKKAAGGEGGDVAFPFLSNNPNFPSAFRKIVDGLLEMEQDMLDCCGAVFLMRKLGQTI
ncbi:class I SAM-dependent methyltransferase [Paraburkholderia dinghuensis]|uniref:Class I SAM-dependent methyltransferase n=1 Tax=Paraburkholderia dinghuensis TaxID=2305225 RepID=A0A3N6MWL4_9BURK|nr:class I SAM-dependent methyltransferase [Paraburkholderia dinghuensis]RQH08358.1 class I SAM-dependent methyltransferase [Paraburkholderia dinghuensis]